MEQWLLLAIFFNKSPTFLFLVYLCPMLYRKISLSWCNWHLVSLIGFSACECRNAGEYWWLWQSQEKLWFWRRNLDELKSLCWMLKFFSRQAVFGSANTEGSLNDGAWKTETQSMAAAEQKDILNGTQYTRHSRSSEQVPRFCKVLVINFLVLRCCS